MADETEYLDGCDLDFKPEPTAEEEIDAVILFADVDVDSPEAVAARVQEWEALHAA